MLGGLSPRLIEPGRLTVAALLKQHGYHTACVGKWHLGMDWVKQPGKEVTELNIETPEQVWNVDYTKPIANGPNCGRLRLLLRHQRLARHGAVHVHRERPRDVRARPSTAIFPLMLGRDGGPDPQGPGRAGLRRGRRAARPDAARPVEYIGQRAADAKAGKPFFLYLPLASPHTPIAADAGVAGQERAEPLRRLRHADRRGRRRRCWPRSTSTAWRRTRWSSSPATTAARRRPSSRSCVPKGHNPSHVFRGHKADIYRGRPPRPVPRPLAGAREAGHDERPARLPDRPDGDRAPRSSARSCPTTPARTASASCRRCSARHEQPLREAVVHHSINGSFAIRQGKWKLCLCPGSGGWSAPRPGRDDTSRLPPVQLFDLASDIGEKKNVQAEHPEVVARLTKLLEKYVADGRSTPGEPQKNAVAVDIRKDSRYASDSGHG